MRYDLYYVKYIPIALEPASSTVHSGPFGNPNVQLPASTNDGMVAARASR